ncbi:hypothetical protein Atep_10680 [Allochromatium tepidum]|uniref:Uncharacterized protein n=1 Tax=Allochromatium tepidum TaxID=553982 RepID=A0ABM7QKR6_9GAMM|nr:hypothetical protein Atep_10680 [Allochromatium tepidum]
MGRLLWKLLLAFWLAHEDREPRIYTRISQILQRVLQHQSPHRKQPPLPIIKRISRRGKHRWALYQRHKLGTSAEHDRSPAVPDTTGREGLRCWRGDTETQVFGEVGDGLRQFAVARLEQLLEQTDSLFDGDL